MNRGLTGISFTIHGGGGFQLGDIVDDNGRVIPYGVNILKAFKAKRQLVINVPDREGNPTTLIVPYHAVMEYAVMKAVDDIPKPSDAFCGVNHGKTWVIKFYDETGDTLLATYRVPNGRIPVYKGEPPICESSIGAADGWRDSLDSRVQLIELPPATADASYYAWCMK